MPKYRVYLATIASASVVVEAEDEETAFDEAYQHEPFICAQCAGWDQSYSMDLGDWELERELLRDLSPGSNYDDIPLVELIEE